MNLLRFYLSAYVKNADNMPTSMPTNADKRVNKQANRRANVLPGILVLENTYGSLRAHLIRLFFLRRTCGEGTRYRVASKHI